MWQGADAEAAEEEANYMRTKQLETLISGFLGVRTGWPPATDLREWEGKRIL